MRAPVIARSAICAPISPVNRAKMRFMDDSIAHPADALARFELAGWKTWVGVAAAVLTSALFLGIVETFAGVLVLVPRFRRWGATLGGLLLVVFMIYIGVNYEALRGAECSCFPWVKRAVGPGFFIGDGVMLGLAALAGFWAK